MAEFGGLGGLGGFDPGNLFAALGASLLTSPRYAPLQGLPAGIQAANERSRQSGSDAAMQLALTKAGIAPEVAATLAMNPTAAALMISQGNAEKQQAFRLKAMESLGGGSLVPPGPGGGVGGLGGLGGASSEAAPSDLLGAAKAAIANNESAGSGGYAAVGPEVKGDRAYGKYQVMGANIPEWTRKHLGQEMSVRQFMASPEAQDKVFEGEFGGYLKKYGNINDAASMWFSGRPMAAAGNASDGYTTVPQYVAKVNSFLGKNGAAPVQVAQADTGTATDALPTNQFAGPGAKIPAATPDKALPGLSPAPVGANATRAWANREAQRALGVIAGAGDDKGLMEAAKAKFDAVKGYLTQSEAEKNLAAAGIDPTSRAGREALTGGVGIKLEQLGLDKQKQELETSKFDFERFQKDREYRQQVENQNRTEGSKSYDIYARDERAAGREPLARLDYAVKLARAGSPQPEGVEDVKRAESVTKFLDTQATRAPTLSQRSADLDVLGRVINKTATGRGANVRATLDAAAAELGLSKGTLATQQDFVNAITNRIAPSLRDPGSGSQSDTELRGFLSAMPHMTGTPEGNQLILSATKRAAAIDNERASIAARWQSGDLSAKEARSKIAELDGKSIYASPEEKEYIAKVMGFRSDTTAPAPSPALEWVPGKGLQRK